MAYTTRRDAQNAVNEQLPDASAELRELVTNQAWREQQAVSDAVAALSAHGVDCEGYEEA